MPATAGLWTVEIRPELSIAMRPAQIGACANHLTDFSGILQVDGAAYNELVKTREPSKPIILAFYWTRLRRRFYEIAAGGNVPLAGKALPRLLPFTKGWHLRTQNTQARLKIRQAKTRPLSITSNSGSLTKTCKLNSADP